MKSIRAGAGFTWAYTHIPGFEYVPLLACSKPIINLPVRLSMKGNSKCPSSNFLSMQEALYKDLAIYLTDGTNWG